jgi:predicted PurR-regulated permease PerM
LGISLDTVRRLNGRDIALTLAAFVVIVAGLRSASVIVVPFLLALFVAVISTPFVVQLKQFGLPNFLAVFMVVVVLLIIGGAIVAFVGTSIQSFSQNTRQYERELREKTDLVLNELDRIAGGNIPVESIMDDFNERSAVGFFTRLLTGLGSTFGNAFLVALAVIFMLLEASGFPKKVSAIVGGSLENHERLRDMVDDIRHYMFLKTIISLATGSLIAMGLAILGVPYPLMWDCWRSFSTMCRTSVRFSLRFPRSYSHCLRARPCACRFLSRDCTFSSTYFWAICWSPGSWAVGWACPRWWFFFRWYFGDGYWVRSACCCRRR